VRRRRVAPRFGPVRRVVVFRVEVGDFRRAADLRRAVVFLRVAPAPEDPEDPPGEEEPELPSDSLTLSS